MSLQYIAIRLRVLHKPQYKKGYAKLSLVKLKRDKDSIAHRLLL